MLIKARNAIYTLKIKAESVSVRVDFKINCFLKSNVLEQHFLASLSFYINVAQNISPH